MTLARVLLTLSGFLCAVNGLLGGGPDAPPATRTVGIALILVGLLTWALVWWLRRPRSATVVPPPAVVALIAAARVAQFTVLHSPVILLAIVLPAVALRRVA